MIYLIRHGESEWNILKKFNGVTETSLTSKGIVQAEKQAEKLKNVMFDSCFCSPLRRARQTCEIIYNNHVTFDERLIEIDCGDFEGMTETAKSMRKFWQAAMTGDRRVESFTKFINRNSDFCNMIRENHDGKNILIITHAANARVINYCLSGKQANYNFMKPIATNGEIITYS